MITPVEMWRNQKQTALKIGQTGKITQWTIIRTPAKSFAAQTPYPLVIVELDNGKKVIGQLVDWEFSDLTKGKQVIAVFRKMEPENSESIITYTIKFKPHEDR